MRKYEFTGETKNYLGVTLHRIKSLIDFGDVKSGEIGGWIETEDNLSQYGDSWVSGNAQVYGDAKVYDNAHVFGNARVFGDAQVYDDAQVSGYACISGYAWVSGYACISGDACISGNAWVSGYARISGDACISGNARISGEKCVFWISGIGSRNGTTTFFNCEDGKIRVSCGCFYGDLDEFLKAVNKTHGDNEYGQVYRIAIEMAKKRIHTVCEDVKND